MDRFECLECGEEFSIATKSCPKCGSNKIGKLVSFSDTVKIRTALKLTVKDKAGKITRKSLSRQKVSNHGKEAKEELTIDIAGNRKYHHVEEKGKNGNWKVVHHENKPLKNKKTRKKAQHI